MNRCFAYSSCESEHGCCHGDMLHTIKGFDEAQGLVCLLDGHWGRVFDKNRQSLDDFFSYEYVSVDSSSISELHAFPRPSRDVFGKSVDAEWKWILGQQQASLCDLLTPSKSMDRYASNLLVDSGSHVKGDVKHQVTADFSLANVLCPASKVESCPHAGISKPQRVNMMQPFEANAAVLPNKGTLSWQAPTSNKELAATIPYKGHTYAENCGLPRFTFGAEGFNTSISPKDCVHTEGYELPPLVSSLTWGEECTTNSSADFCEGNEAKLTADISSLRRTPPCELVSGVVEPTVIPISLLQPSVHDKSSYPLDDENIMLKESNKTCLGAKKPECEILGEALCHAQTRARVAEKLAAQAVKERDQLAHLLLREAWTSFTYKQRAQALELENRLLKLCLNMDIEVWTGGDVMYSMGQIARTCCKPAQKRDPFQDKRDLCTSNSQQDKSGKGRRSWGERLLLSCAIGLAFVLGLSIAGAGLMIGWNMGWMLFS